MRGLVASTGGVVLALCLSQFPEFAQQYEQRLGGAVDELSAIVLQFDQTASQEGLSRTEALATYDRSPEAFLNARGADMRETIARKDKLETHLVEVQSASPFARLTNFAAYFDNDIARRAWDAFKPAVPVTLEGITYALVGFFTGYAGLSLVLAPFRRRPRRTRTHPAQNFDRTR